MSCLTRCFTTSLLLTVNIYRLQLGLQGYKILFATQAFVHQRQVNAGCTPSPTSILLWIDGFHSSSKSSHNPRFPLVRQFTVTARFAIPSLYNCSTTPSTNPKHLSHHDKRLLPLFSRGCWHRVARSFHQAKSIISRLVSEVYIIVAFRSSTDSGSFSLFSSLTISPYCCLRKGVGTFLSFLVAEPSFVSARHPWFGEQLPHQQPF